jgi:heavy metal sensor kinase
VSRLPIRLRLTLAFATAIAAVLAGGGFLLFDRLAGSLDRTLNQSLRVRAADAATLIQQVHGSDGQQESGGGLREGSPVAGAGESFAQVLDRRGRIFDQTPGLGSRPLLGGHLLAQARTRAVLVPRAHRLGTDVRLLALPVRAQDQPVVIIVGMPLRSRDQALASLRRELLFGGPIALLVTSLIGYLVAAAALRPVERMRTHARSISERRLSERLPVPRVRDELARLGETLNEMLTRIEHGITRERRFVADASHELRSPLALVRTEVELALEAPRTNDELRAALHSIGEEADRLSQLTEDLLLLARLDEGQLALREEPVDLGTLLNDIAARFSRRADEAHRPLEVADPGGLQVVGDRLRLRQAFTNLVDNALRYGAGTIRLLASETPDGVEIHVTDEGPGFPANFAPSAFERFSRADPARSSAGAGLGLAIVKGIAEAHHGSVTLTQAGARGADVCVHLPTGGRQGKQTQALPGEPTDNNGRPADTRELDSVPSDEARKP